MIHQVHVLVEFRHNGDLPEFSQLLLAALGFDLIQPSEEFLTSSSVKQVSAPCVSECSHLAHV